jgi:hypothetical protein
MSGHWFDYIPNTPLVLTGLATILGYLARFTIKKAIDAIKAEWEEVKSRLARIENVQGKQAENHLQTIETNTSRANEILGLIHTDISEQKGYLKAISEKNSSSN